MRIVIFHARIAHLTGGEVNARDWALGLKARGHKIVLYAIEPGPLAEQIRNAGVAVVTDPASIADVPDVMFGCGINDVVSLLARFPNVPAIQVAQIWDHWNAYPSLLPQVVLHVGMDELNAEMFVNEFGIPRDRVRVILNSVDMTHVVPRQQPLPSRPARALVIIKQDTGYSAAVRDACAKRNITVEFFGYPMNRPLYEPLAAMSGYDLVIGTARTALEGAVAGAAVIIADQRGLAGMLTTSNLDRFRKDNFGREILVRPTEAVSLGAEIDRYDSLDAMRVTQILQTEATLSRQMEQWEAVFIQAIDLFRGAPPTEDESRRALSTYLSRHLPRAWEPSPRHSRLRGGMFFEERITAMGNRIGALEARSSELYSELAGVKQRATEMIASIEAQASTAQGNREVDARITVTAKDLASAIAQMSTTERELVSFRAAPNGVAKLLGKVLPKRRR